MLDDAKLIAIPTLWVLFCIQSQYPEKEVTQGPKPLGAQLPYESDPFEPGNLVLRPVPKTWSVYLLLRIASRANLKII